MLDGVTAVANQWIRQPLVFIGSTYEDLQEYRAEIFKSLRELEIPFNAMEFFGATPNPPLDECLKNVRASKIYVGIFAHRYGRVDKSSGKSFTQLEYEEAQKLKLPSLIYVIDDECAVKPRNFDDGENKAKLVALKQHLLDNHTVYVFNTIQNLVKQLSEDVTKLIGEIGQQYPIEQQPKTLQHKTEDNGDEKRNDFVIGALTGIGIVGGAILIYYLLLKKK